MFPTLHRTAQSISDVPSFFPLLLDPSCLFQGPKEGAKLNPDVPESPKGAHCCLWDTCPTATLSSPWKLSNRYGLSNAGSTLPPTEQPLGERAGRWSRTGAELEPTSCLHGHRDQVLALHYRHSSARAMAIQPPCQRDDRQGFVPRDILLKPVLVNNCPEHCKNLLHRLSLYNEAYGETGACKQ